MGIFKRRQGRLNSRRTAYSDNAFTSKVGDIVGALRQEGITTYAVTPLLPYLNDNPDDILAIASACRRHGIEFHHLYLTGLFIQRSWQMRFPLDLSCVIDIASHLREYGSGREVPRYVLWTPLGEFDFGISTRVMGVDDKDQVLIKIIDGAESGGVVVPVPGLCLTATIEESFLEAATDTES